MKFSRLSQEWHIWFSKSFAFRVRFGAKCSSYVITNDLLLVVICTAFDEFVFLCNFWIRPIDRRHNINDFNWINFKLLVFIISETLKMNESIMFNALSLQLIEKTLVRRRIKRRWWKKNTMCRSSTGYSNQTVLFTT